MFRWAFSNGGCGLFAGEGGFASWPRNDKAQTRGADGMACESLANYLVGSTSRPKNRREPERVSRMKNMKGRSARKIGGGGSGLARLQVSTVATVAAAASVPSSFTSPHALWNTPEM